MTEKFNQPLGGNQMPRFGGPATMMRLPTQAGTDGLDACFVGIPHGHRHLEPRRHALWPAADPGRILPDPALQHGDAGRALRQPDGRRYRRCGDRHLQSAETAWTSSPMPIDAIIAKGCRPLTLGRRSHADLSDPARHREETWARRPGPCRCPCRHQREHVRREDRPWHAVPPRRRGQAARHQALHPDRAPRHAAMRRMISTGRASRASASSRPRNAGTNRSPR